MKILTAFREGGQYTQDHVKRLAQQVKTHSGLALDVVYGKRPHWWCKMDVFTIKGPVLYFDLDTTILDDLSPLIEVAQKYRFTTLSDFNRSERSASGVMAWSGDMSYLHSIFEQDPQGYMNQYPGGDQDFIDDRESPQFWQDLLPNMIQSYKCHIRRNMIHPECRVVAFHGKPKPWDIEELTKE